MAKDSNTNKNKQCTDDIPEEVLDSLVRSLLTPKMFGLMLKDEKVIAGALHETKKARADDKDIQGLSTTFGISVESVKQTLEEVEGIFTEILGGLTEHQG